MPKKRHWARYTKPQTTAPHSLESHGLQSHLRHDEPQARSVNARLANLRRTQLATSGSDSGGEGVSGGSAGAGLPVLHVAGPSVPPEIAQILQPSAVGPGGRGAGGVQAGFVNGGGGGGGMAAGRGGAGAGAAGGGRGRGRGPAGPAPPPSWLSQSVHAPRRFQKAGKWTGERRQEGVANAIVDMPGVSLPERMSLVDLILNQMVRDWEFQRHYNQHYLPYMPGALKAALISHLSTRGHEGKGVSIADLRAVLLPPPAAAARPPSSPGDDDDNDDDDGSSSGDSVPSPGTLNEDFRYLDLSVSVGRSIHLKELADLLFPAGTTGANSYGKGKGKGKDKDKENTHSSLQYSWDAPELMSPPRPLLPNLTHLSLAQEPRSTASSWLSSSSSSSRVSWRQLLSFAAHLPTLTHLSLAYWPEPSLTPNAKYTTVVSPQGRRVQFGGTGPYSHSLDDDWAEAILVVRKLSKALYGLEYLDLTGCAAWFPALMKREDYDEVDWVGDWGKVTTLVLCYGGDGGGGGDRVVDRVVDTAEVEQPQPQLQPQAGPGEVARQVNAASEAQLVERHIRQQRAGQGRFITVVGDRSTADRGSGSGS